MPSTKFKCNNCNDIWSEGAILDGKGRCPNCRTMNIDPITFSAGGLVPENLVETTQKDRQSNYGAWMPHAKTVDIIMESLRDLNKDKNNGELYWPTGFETNMFYIVTKIARMATDPQHHDSTLDLKSYADLWLKEIEETK